MSNCQAMANIQDSHGWSAKLFLQRAKQDLDMALQPIAFMKGGGLYGFEALMRGYGEMGLPSIASVLDTAYRLDLACELHLILLEKSLQKLRTLDCWRESKLFFNFDGRTFENCCPLEQATESLLARYEFRPSSLCMEFPENYDHDAEEGVARTVARHRGLGIRFAIDDFGRGISELKVLYDHRPEIIKIDRFFVQDLVNDSRKRLFVSTLVNLAHVLGSRVVAEGVETEEEYRQCWQLGCDFVQGYFICPPRRDFSDGEILPRHLGLVNKLSDLRRSNTAGIFSERIERLEPIAHTASMREVFEAFRFSQKQVFLPVIDEAGEPKGLVRECDLKEFTYSPYGRDLLSNNSCSRKLGDFIRECPVTEIDAAADEILNLIAYSEGADGIIVTQNARYVGFLSATALLDIINDKRIERARDQNPLSNLPGNMTITGYAEQLARDTSAERHICYIDFDNFKPFNDNYSFREGDRAIMLFADLLRRSFPEPAYMIGHIGGDDFFLGASGVTTEELRARLATLRTRFGSSVSSLYRPEDRAQGHIVATDRRGKRCQFPLLQCSIAILNLPIGYDVGRIDPVMFEITRLKREAKRSPDGIASGRFRQDRPHKAGPAMIMAAANGTA